MKVIAETSLRRQTDFPRTLHASKANIPRMNCALKFRIFILLDCLLLCHRARATRTSAAFLDRVYVRQSTCGRIVRRARETIKRSMTRKTNKLLSKSV